ncbi:hypothetical protein [Stutzerimonas xanthomarina]|uniref:hypothetical protein n=1 Tax=Stutzerimonas xanthomarina TaxID=271420 RepID=UPI003AA95E08
MSQSIEPTYQNLYVKSNLSGEFTVINPYLVHDSRPAACGTRSWSTTQYYDGFRTADRAHPAGSERYVRHRLRGGNRGIVDAASRRQKWIDQAQSLNLYIAGASAEARRPTAWPGTVA